MDFKKVIISIFATMFIVVLSINFAYAETAVPTNELTNESTPTPSPNVIYSIGDFKLTAQYEDKRNVNENLAINVKKSNINTLSPQIIQSIRAQEGDKDIFAYFELELQMNGRKTTIHYMLILIIMLFYIIPNYRMFIIIIISIFII